MSAWRGGDHFVVRGSEFEDELDEGSKVNGFGEDRIHVEPGEDVIDTRCRHGCMMPRGGGARRPSRAVAVTVAMVTEPGPLLATGRDCDVFAYGDGAVLRRSRQGRSMADEARTMEYARQHGVPVPAIHEISDDGTEMVMERVNGPSMGDLVTHKPWLIRSQGRLLAEVHRLVHDVAAPDWVPAAFSGDGDRLVHLDLHPFNVLIGEGGPVVIDWPNAARGDGALDVALAWTLIATAGIPTSRWRAAVLDPVRSLFVNSFLSGCDRDRARAVLPAVIEWKAADINMTEAECVSMRKLAQRVRG
jgi:hypothetical protein